MDCHDILVIGASLGGVETLPRLLSQLPADFPGSIFIVQHTASGGPGLLASILDRSCAMDVKTAHHGQTIANSCVYVAPPDHHMLVKPGMISIVKGPKENSTRPAIDPLFRSAAVSYGPRVVGVILTGALDDGSSGLLAVKRCNGVAVVQEPGDAFCPEMPQSALSAAGSVDYQLAIAEMGPILEELSARPAAEPERYSTRGQDGRRGKPGDSGPRCLPGLRRRAMGTQR